MPLLEVKDISKSFSGVQVLKDLNIKVMESRITAVTGENGAGKTTLMKIISGVYTDYEGQIFLNNEEVKFRSTRDAVDKGIIIIHQELNLVPYLSIAENIFMGREPVNRFGMIDYQKMHNKTREILSRLQFDINPAYRVNRLKVGQKQMVEIARALLFKSRLVIMDEPTSALSDHESELLFRIIKDLKNKGVAIIYISHKLDELFRIADNYFILRDGELAGSGGMADITRQEMIQMMVGRKISDVCTEKKEKRSNNEILRVEDLSMKDPQNTKNYKINNINFSLRKGEVLGICGLMGSGRTEVLEAIFGLYPDLVSGRIFIEGKETLIKNVKDAIRQGIALVPEDRSLQGLIMDMDLAKNTSLASLEKICRLSFINKKKETDLADYYTEKLNIQVPSPDIEVRKLSGGNQQKVVIAKWMATNPRILLLDEPTRGIDVGAKAEMYELIRELACKGMGIIAVSSELPEILKISDNIIVLSESKQTANIRRSEANEEIIMKAALAEKH